MPRNWFSDLLNDSAGSILTGSAAGFLLLTAVLIGPAAWSGADGEECAHWEYRHWTCKIDGDHARSTSRQKLVVQNARGDFQAAASFSENKFVKLKKIRITVRDGFGKVVRELSRKDLDKHCGFGASYEVYSDICSYEYTPAMPKYPYSVEYEVEHEFKSLFFLNGTQVATDIPVATATCSLRCPPQTSLHFKTYGLAPPEPTDIINRDRVLAWTFEGLDAIDDDTLSALQVSHAGELAIMVNEFKFADAELSRGTWAGLGEWFSQVVDERCDEIRDPAFFSDSAADASDRLRKIYDRTREDNRYVSITIGVSGWRPRKASHVAETRYGDCKDLSTLLISQLRSAGIEAHPALIRTRGEGYVDPDFPSTGFNHVIATAFIGGDTIWMDPTCNVCPLGVIPWGDQFTHALIASGPNSRLVPTPISNAPDNLRLRKTELSLNPDLHLSLKTEISLRGSSATNLRSTLSSLDRSDITMLAAELLSERGVEWGVRKAAFTNTDDAYLPLIFAIEAQSVKPVRVIGKTAYIEAGLFDVDPDLTDEDLSGRTRPIRLRYPWQEMDSVRIHIDPEIGIDSIVTPPDQFDSCSFAFSRITAAPTPGEITLVSLVSFHAREIPAAEFDNLNAFEDRLSSRSRDLVKLYLAR